LTDHDPGIYAEEHRVSTGTPGPRPKGRAALERPPLHYAEVHVPEPRWFLTCSCGWTRECSSQWAAESVAKLHPKLGEPGTAHTVRIEEPQDPDLRRQPGLPLFLHSSSCRRLSCLPFLR